MLSIIKLMTYLLRVNLDIEEKHPEKLLRFHKAAETIKKLNKGGNKVVILSHIGRPKGFESRLSLKRFVLPLSRTLGKKVVFLPLGDFNKIKGVINKYPRGGIFLLENLRIESGGTVNSAKFAKNLASLGDKYVNDDFATSHRKNASNVGILRFLPGKAGPNLSHEVKRLQSVLRSTKKPFVLIIGGIKMSDKIAVIKNLLPRADYVLLGGGPANTFLEAKGEKVGKSLFDKEMISEVKKFLNNKKIFIPVDSKKSNGRILDIGPITSRRYSQIINKARTVIWGGPVGFFEDTNFAQGTKTIWQAILKNKRAKVVVGGGETVASLKLVNKNYNVENGIFLSTGGGAMLEFLAGKKLPALTALNLQKK